MRPWWAGRDSKYPSARCSCCGHLVNTSRLYFVHFSLLYFTDTAHIDQSTLNIPDAAAVNVLHLQCNSWTVQDIAFISGILRRHVLLMQGQGLKIPRDGRCNCCGQVSNISPLPSLHLMIFIAMLLHSFTPNKLGFNRWLVFDTSDFLAKSQCHSRCTLYTDLNIVYRMNSF